MGFFSWLTADTKESIRNRHSAEGATPVYMLFPYNKPTIRGEFHLLETSYDGYGLFQSIDAYKWLARANYPKSWYLPDETRREIGIELDVGDCYRDKNTGELFHKAGRFLFPGMKRITGLYNERQEGYDMSPNELLDKGIWSKEKVRDNVKFEREYLPLKFSFDEHAVYEDLPPSERDPSQGFFPVENKKESEDETS